MTGRRFTDARSLVIGDIIDAAGVRLEVTRVEPVDGLQLHIRGTIAGTGYTRIWLVNKSDRIELIR